MTETNASLIPPTESFFFAGGKSDILISAERTGGAFALLHVTSPPGRGTPPHLHIGEEETPLVISGKLHIETEGETFQLSPGDSLILPRGRAHRLSNRGTLPTRSLLLCTPAGFDGFVRAAGRPADGSNQVDEVTPADIARLRETAPSHGITLTNEESLQAPAPTGSASTRKVVPSERLETIGASSEILAMLGSSEEDLCMIRQIIAPGGVVPLQSHGAAESIYIVSGELELVTNFPGQPTRSVVRAGEVATVPSGIRHAYRNHSSFPVQAVMITTIERAGFLRANSRRMTSMRPDSTLRDRLEAVARLGKEWSCWHGTLRENVEFGLFDQQPVDSR